MKIEANKVKPKTLDDFGKKVVQYLKDLPPEVLEVENTGSVEILGTVTGSYNINFHVRVDQKEFIFRINIEQQSKLQDQIGYEYRVLKFIEGYNIAPRVYHIDKSIKSINYGILIEEYFDGFSFFSAKIVLFTKFIISFAVAPVIKPTAQSRYLSSSI